MSSNSPSCFIGLMSGTSLDGVDAVLTNLNSYPPKLLATYSHPIPEKLRKKIQTTLHPEWAGNLKAIGTLNHELGLLFSDAVNQLIKNHQITPKQVKAIGSHGQTLWHEPLGGTPFTMQLGDANLIAEHTGITTVADFRSRDIAAHGQGAPLVPAFHKEVLGDANKHRVILNVGGIANISVLPSTESKNKVFGFDTGPGNGLLDAWIALHEGTSYDKNGDWARTGTICSDALKILLKDEYFVLEYPKSTGKEAFNLFWLKEKLGYKLDEYRPEDIQATLLELTAISIAKPINHCGFESSNEVYVCGGGIHNNYLMERLNYHLSESKISSTETLGIDPDWMEALAFAWLAKQTLEGKPGNLPEVTGATGLRILGAIYQA